MLNFVVDTVYKPMAFSLQFVDPLSFGFKSIRRRCHFGVSQTMLSAPYF